MSAPQPLPTAKETGYAKVNGAEIYYAIYGSGEPLIQLHGGLGKTDYWGGQIAAFSAQYNVINIASRGHGRSTRDDQAYSYYLMASDVLAVMDILSIKKASIVGWSDGGNIGIDIAIKREPLNEDFRFYYDIYEYPIYLRRGASFSNHDRILVQFARMINDPDKYG